MTFSAPQVPHPTVVQPPNRQTCVCSQHFVCDFAEMRARQQPRQADDHVYYVGSGGSVAPVHGRRADWTAHSVRAKC